MRRARWFMIPGAIAVALATGGAAMVLRSAHSFHPKSHEAILLPGKDGDATLLFNGWRISPAGKQILECGDMLLGGTVSPDGKTLAIASAGYNQHALHLIDIATEKEIAQFPVQKAWNGIAWSATGSRVYVGGGVANPEADVYAFDKDSAGQWARGAKLKIAEPDKKTANCIAGIALSPNKPILFALDNSHDKLHWIDLGAGEDQGSIAVGDHPVACRMSVDGNTLYVALWGGSEVAVLDVRATPSVSTRIKTGEHPNDLALGKDGRLYVTCGNSDEVNVIDTKSNSVTERIKTTLSPDAPAGTTPNALSISDDNRTLYVANADNNDICSIDISRPGRSRVTGFIPTGWYPTAVIAADRKLFIGSGKGMGTGPNFKKPIHPAYPGPGTYIAKQLGGSIAVLDAPTSRQLAELTKQVYSNTPYRDSQLKTAASPRKTAIPTRVGGSSPIKHVLYIIKENRTYDQVLGDIPKGNGDPELTLFGRDVTPNHHALADQFVLLDNLYCSGEVSADGHPWSTSAIATDFTQRSWVLSYSGHGQTRYSDSVSIPKAGYIWDACARKGLTYRSYGEYSYATSGEAAPEQRMEGATGLKGHGSPTYVGVGWPKGRDMRDMDKADAFIEELKEFERKGTIPQFMVMSLGEDHTEGSKLGAYTPKAKVASNDQALGKIVEAISQSSAWKEFAIFVIEDDAQNGPDHVDAHRTVGLVISPYCRRNHVDSTMYSTASMLRTMELILGLPPLTQYDASATPMFESFMDKPDLTPYGLLPARVSLTARNEKTAYGVAESSKMDWSEYDRMDEQALNRILWHSIKGRDKPMPAPVRRAFAHPSGVVARDVDTDD